MEKTISTTDRREDPENEIPQPQRQQMDFDKDGDVIMSDNQQVRKRLEREKAQMKNDGGNQPCEEKLCPQG